jgi:hypothetical protein
VPNRPATPEERDEVKSALAGNDVVSPDEFVRAFLILLSGTVPSQEMEAALVKELAFRGVKHVKLLGHGASALAGQTVTGNVVKLTFDEDDAKASIRIQGLDLPRVAQVYDAVLLNPPDAWRPFGLIFQEYAGWPGLPIPGDDADLNRLIIGLNQENKVWRVFERQVKGRTAEKVMRDAVVDLIEALEGDSREPFQEIAQGLRQLMGHGVYVVDPNSGNVAFGKAGLKLIDLGLSLTTSRPS